MHKIRADLLKQDSRYKLNGSLEFDEGYFEQVKEERIKLKIG